jgi:hypothetical protein
VAIRQGLGSVFVVSVTHHLTARQATSYQDFIRIFGHFANRP